MSSVPRAGSRTAHRHPPRSAKATRALDLAPAVYGDAQSDAAGLASLLLDTARPCTPHYQPSNKVGARPVLGWTSPPPGRREPIVRSLRCRAAACVIAAVALAACSGSHGGVADAGIFTPPTFDGGAHNKEVGEACAGSGDCRTDVCLHYLPGPTTGFSCSRKCDSDAVCPVGWSCQNVYPGPRNDFCVPPRSWTPQVAQLRSTGNP